MFEAFQLHKSFPHRTLFHQLSFRLPKQGLVLITGESGSGKTTFLYGLQGLVPLSGKWIVNGVDVFALNREQKLEFRQRYIGVVYQNMMLIPHATVKETLQLAAHLKGVDLQSQRHILDQGLFTEVRMDQRIDSLSLGQKQRLSCYIASLGQPLYYLFDEPTTGLDLVNRQLIYALIEKLAQHALVMLTSHEKDELPCQPILHLHFPLPATSPEKFFPNTYQRFRSIQPLPSLPTRWMIAYQMRTLRSQKGHLGRQMLQVFFLSLFAVFVSLTSIVQVELKQFSQTMIGGQYAYYQENQKYPPLKVQSAALTELNPSIHEAMRPSQFASHYDDQFFQAMFNVNQWVIEEGPLRVHLKDFGLETFNHTQYLPLTPHTTWKHQSLQQDEVVLGIDYTHLRELSQLRRVFPTLETLNQSLKLKPLAIIIEVDQPAWNYQDSLLLWLRGVVFANQPTVYHSDQRFNEFIFETSMRLPTKDFAEVYEQQPWRLSKTAALWLKDVPRFIESFVMSPRCFGFYVQRIGEHKVTIMRSFNHTYGMQKSPEKLQKLTLNDNQAGYHFFPNHRLSGFAQPTFLTSTYATLQPFLEAIEVMHHPQAWLDVTTPEQLLKGHWLNQSDYGLKFHPIDQALDTDKIIISSAMAKHLQISIHQTVYFASVRDTHIHESLQTVRTFFVIPLTVQHIIESPWMVLYQLPQWLTTTLLVHGDYHSADFHPRGWAYYGKEDFTLSGFSKINPYQEVENVFQTWTSALSIGNAVFLFIFGLPALVGFYSQLKRQLFQERHVLKSLFLQGASTVTTRKIIMMKVKIVLTEIAGATMLSFFILDYYLKQTLKTSLWLNQDYRLPWLETLLIMVVFFAFYQIIHMQIIFQESTDYQ